MAGGQEVTIKEYRFKIRPASRWRKITADYWPYWQASKISFELHVVGEERNMFERDLQLYFVLPGGSLVQRIVKVPSINKGDKYKLALENFFSALTGDTSIILDVDLRVREEGSSPAIYETLYVFHVTPKAWVSLAVIAGILAGVIGAILQLLIGSSGD